jgi:hypothetical protein
MRALFLCLALTALAGCSSLVRQDGDYFEASGVSQERFEADNNACHAQADDYLSYGLHGMDGTRYQQNRTFNTIYGRCMKARGYRSRPYWKNLLPS